MPSTVPSSISKIGSNQIISMASRPILIGLQAMLLLWFELVLETSKSKLLFGVATILAASLIHQPKPWLDRSLSRVGWGWSPTLSTCVLSEIVSTMQSTVHHVNQVLLDATIRCLSLSSNISSCRLDKANNASMMKGVEGRHDERINYAAAEEKRRRNAKRFCLAHIPVRRG